MGKNFYKDNMKVKYLLLCAAMFIALSGCKNQHGGQTDETACHVADTTDVQPRHAKGFSVKRMKDGTRLVELKDPQGESGETYRFALIGRGDSKSEVPEGYAVVEVPVRSVICMTSLQLSNFIKLDEIDAVVGITSTRHLFNKEIKERIDKGLVHRIGIEGNFDNETIMGINPDIILFSPFKRGGYAALKDVGIPLIPHLGYKEQTPLGQAEWIKLVGLLIGESEKADAVFDGIEKRYMDLCGLTDSVDYRPMVLSGETRGGAWYAVGGKSFLAQLFKDAGADYFLKDDESTGGKNFDFETVYSQAANAEYWRIVNSYKGDFSYETLKEEDERYADFRAFKERGIIYCNMSKRPFYENMPTEPEVVLADLIHAFHPELLPDHKPVYYELLR